MEVMIGYHKLLDVYLVDDHLVIWTSPLLDGRPDLGGAVAGRVASELHHYHTDCEGQPAHVFNKPLVLDGGS